MTAEELENSCPTFVAIQVKEMIKAKEILNRKYSKVLEDEEREFLRIYDASSPEEVVKYLFENGVIVTELKTDKIGLEEYYINLMERGREVKYGY